jgi:hypothetical protein
MLEKNAGGKPAFFYQKKFKYEILTRRLDQLVLFFSLFAQDYYGILISIGDFRTEFYLYSTCI